MLAEELHSVGPTRAEEIRGRKWLLPLVASLVAVALYLPTLSFQFVWDDVYFVVRNTTIRSWTTIPEDFTSPKAYAAMVDPRFYRPLRNISYRIDWSVAGANPRWWHAHNVILHAVNTSLVYLLILSVIKLFCIQSPSRGTTISASVAAFVATLLWAVHPVHTEAVAWIKSRDELLFTLWSLACIICVIRELLRPSCRFRTVAVSAVIGALALLSKEMAVSLPLLVFFIALLFKWEGRHKRFLLLSGAILLVETALFVAIRHIVLGGTPMCGYLSGSFVHEMLTMVRAASRYVTVTLFPWKLYADYSHFDPTRSLADPRLWVAALIVSATLVLAGISWRKNRLVCFGIGWFWIALLPVSNVVPTMQYLAERFLYFPTIGAAIAVGGLLHRMDLKSVATENYEGENVPSSKRLRAGALYLALLGAVVAAFTGRTALRLGDWRDEFSLYTATLRDAPRNGRALINVAMALANRGEAAEAERLLEYLESSRDPLLRNVNPQMLLRAEAAVAMRTGRFAEAKTLWQKALEIAPDDVDARCALGVCLGMEGNHEAALEQFTEALRQDPLYPFARSNAAAALRMLGRNREAEAVEHGAPITTGSVRRKNTSSSPPSP